MHPPTRVMPSKRQLEHYQSVVSYANNYLSAFNTTIRCEGGRGLWDTRRQDPACAFRNLTGDEILGFQRRLNKHKWDEAARERRRAENERRPVTRPALEFINAQLRAHNLKIGDSGACEKWDELRQNDEIKRFRYISGEKAEQFHAKEPAAASCSSRVLKEAAKGQASACTPTADPIGQNTAEASPDEFMALMQYFPSTPEAARVFQGMVDTPENTYTAPDILEETEAMPVSLNPVPTTFEDFLLCDGLPMFPEIRDVAELLFGIDGESLFGEDLIQAA